MKVYFAHSFAGHADARPLRLVADLELSAFLHELDLLGVMVVDPAEIPGDLTEPRRRFEYCLAEIRESDALLVDGRRRLGLGVGAEMMYARIQKVPVFIVVPPASYYRVQARTGEERLHAFVEGLAEKVFLSFEECASHLKHRNREEQNDRRGL